MPESICQFTSARNAASSIEPSALKGVTIAVPQPVVSITGKYNAGPAGNQRATDEPVPILKAALGMARGVFAIKHRQEAERTVRAAAERGFSHQAFFDETKAPIKMEGARIVVKNIKEKAMCMELLKGHGKEFDENPAAETLARRMDDQALQLDRAGGFGEAANNGESAERARIWWIGDFAFRIADEVAGVGTEEGRAMPLFTPLADETGGLRQALQGDDGGDVFRECRAEEHGA